MLAKENMDILRGKKAMCFIALPHHTRFLLPIMEALSHRGMEVVFFTTQAEAAFEITLNEAGLPYRHAQDYLTRDVHEKINIAFRSIRPMWQDRILAHPVMQTAPIIIQDKVIRLAVENLFCFKSMLEVEKPDLLFALHELNPWGKILGYLSHVQRIPYITLQEGLCYAVPLGYRFHTDYSTACMVWGETTRRLLASVGNSLDKTIPLGNLELWGTRDRVTREEATTATRKALGIRPGNKVILFLMGFARYRTFEAPSFANWVKGREDITVIFKWHPLMQKDFIGGALKNLESIPSVLSVQDIDTSELMGMSDVCVLVGQSTSGIEALVFGKPLMEIRLPNQIHSFAGHGVAEPARDLDDLGEKIERILTHGVTPERQEKITQYLASHFSFQDDGTVERLVDVAAEMLRARENTQTEIGEEGRSLSQSSISHPTFPCSLVLPVDDGPTEWVIATLRGIASHVPADLFEIIVVDASSNPETSEILSSLEGDVQVITGDPNWSFSTCCNRAAAEARGKYLVFLKPGGIPCPVWLEGLLEAAQGEKDLNQTNEINETNPTNAISATNATNPTNPTNPTNAIDPTDSTNQTNEINQINQIGKVGIVGGQVLNANGLIWHIGVAFDINQAPFSLYQMMPPDFVGASRQREFNAVQIPFLVAREQFCRMGGFSTDLVNRFEDIDFCLRMKETGARALYTPQSTILRAAGSWEPSPQQDQTNCIRFYARWTGSLWQDDERYLQEDGLDHDSLSALYRDLAARLAVEAQAALSQMQQAPAAG